MSFEYSAPRETEALIEAELRPGERVLWTGQPRPGRLAWQSLPLVLFGIPWTAFAIFWTSLAAVGTWSIPAKADGATQLFKLFPLWGVPFILVGLGMLSSPYWLWRKARRTVYVISDRRAILFEGGVWRGVTVRSFEPDRLKDLRRVQKSDGSGDLVFDQEWSSGRHNSQRSVDVGFLGISNVKEVEEILRGMIAGASGGGIAR